MLSEFLDIIELTLSQGRDFLISRSLWSGLHCILESVSKELNHFAAILHVYAGG